MAQMCEPVLESKGPAVSTSGLGPLYVGVDVGTSSVRAALVTGTGHILSTATQSIDIMEPEPDFYEQSSEQIWNACCQVVKTVTGGVQKSQIHGIGFDGTCSLVVLDKNFEPLTVSPSEDHRWNVIMWLDHRASKQASSINNSNHPCLKYVGGTISQEMEMPKLLWIKQNMEKTWKEAGYFFDLPDYLTWRATGCLSRSFSTLVCKWNYQADKNDHGWDESFLSDIGLSDLKEEDFSKIGSVVQAPGSPCGKGISPTASAELGLAPYTAVGTGILDAHAGGIGTLGCKVTDDESPEPSMSSRLVLVCGTSSCHTIVSESAIFVPGVWGPYYSAMVPGLWLTEGGQSAAGKLLDHIIESHPAKGWLHDDANSRNVHIHSVLEEILLHMCKREGRTDVTFLTTNLHVYPDFHGNRSPLADPTLTGMISGLSLDVGVESLARLYLAAVQALAYGTRHIVESLKAKGHDIRRLYACGGLSKNQLFIQTNADVTGLPIVLPDEKETVLLGAAMLGACASGNMKDLKTAISVMAGNGQIVNPTTSVARYHDKKYNVFLKMVEHQREYQSTMSS